MRANKENLTVCSVLNSYFIEFENFALIFGGSLESP